MRWLICKCYTRFQQIIDKSKELNNFEIEDYLIIVILLLLRDLFLSLFCTRISNNLVYSFYNYKEDK